MTRRKRALTGLITDTLGSGLLFAINLLIAPYVIASLGPALYGCWLTASSILSYLALADLGAGMALIRLVASEKADPVALSNVITTGLCVSFAAGILVLGAGAIISNFVP